MGQLQGGEHKSLHRDGGARARSARISVVSFEQIRRMDLIAEDDKTRERERVAAK